MDSEMTRTIRDSRLVGWQPSVGVSERRAVLLSTVGGDDLGWVLDENTEVFYRTADGQDLLEIEITLRGRLTPVQLSNLQRLFG